MIKKAMEFIVPASLIVLVFATLSLYQCVGFRRIPGPEMEPTVHAGTGKFNTAVFPEYDSSTRSVAVSRMFNYNDVVIYDYEKRPGDDKSQTAGRVIGLPGDKIRIANGDVFVNGSKLGEAYVNKELKSEETLEEYIVPRDTLYLAFDNRSYASTNKKYGFFDSRGVGPIGIWAVIGKIN